MFKGGALRLTEFAYAPPLTSSQLYLVFWTCQVFFLMARNLLMIRLSSLLGILCSALSLFSSISTRFLMRSAFLKKFGRAVRMIRYAKGVSQLKLAELAGCSLQAIGNIERGQANPSIWMVYKIAKALEICPKDLIP